MIDTVPDIFIMENVGLYHKFTEVIHILLMKVGIEKEPRTQNINNLSLEKQSKEKY